MKKYEKNIKHILHHFSLISPKTMWMVRRKSPPFRSINCIFLKYSSAKLSNRLPFHQANNL